MLVYNYDKNEVVELGRGIYQLEELVGNAGYKDPRPEGQDLGCDVEMSDEDIAAWEKVIGNATTVAEVYENAIAAGWTL